MMVTDGGGRNLIGRFSTNWFISELGDTESLAIHPYIRLLTSAFLTS